ncbi:MAG: tRNA-(ms[2]io[6]A)-hydroxylase [Planctomycetes bacterium]|nr:tRNA-(ms[2]io[6]A)-hydroxylase [Planctomycetota bacterium]
MLPADTDHAVAPGRLASSTPPAWARSLVGRVPELLVEQAHLEKKAAAAAVNFLFRVPATPAQHRELSALAREELVHFERTLRLLAARGIAFAPLAPSGYAERLKRAVASTMPTRLVDELLVAALIEARSCERMGCLAAALCESDAEVAGFYADLCTAEERHHVTYVEIAGGLVAADEVRRRWSVLARHEAEVLRTLPAAARLHGGLGESP